MCVLHFVFVFVSSLASMLSSSPGDENNQQSLLKLDSHLENHIINLKTSFLWEQHHQIFSPGAHLWTSAKATCPVWGGGWRGRSWETPLLNCDQTQTKLFAQKMYSMKEIKSIWNQSSIKIVLFFLAKVLNVSLLAVSLLDVFPWSLSMWVQATH